MDITSIVSGILATQDETRQLQIATTILNANTQKNATQTLFSEQALPADPGPSVGGNLDVTASSEVRPGRRPEVGSHFQNSAPVEWCLAGGSYI